MPKRKKRSTPTGDSRSRKKSKAESNRPKSYRSWSEEAMLGTLNAVSEGMGVNRAALQFEIPKTTLKDRVAGRVKQGSKSGRKPYLTSDEEMELVNYINTCFKIGYPKTRIDIMGIVFKTLQERKNEPIDDFNGKGWWLRFMERWPKLALRKGDALAQPRAKAANASNIVQY